MFTKTQAEVLALEGQGPGNVVDMDIHGAHWEHRKYILEVRPPDQPPFRVETNARVPIFSKPEQGNVVKVSYDAQNHRTEIKIEGDPRYDPALVLAAPAAADACSTRKPGRDVIASLPMSASPGTPNLRVG